MDGVGLELDRDARRLLILIGATVEQRVLEQARILTASGAPDVKQGTLIGVDDIREAARIVIKDGATQLESAVLSAIGETHPRFTRRAG